MDGDTGGGVNFQPLDIQKGSTVSLDKVRYDKQTGLVPVVVQSIETGQVLMTAYANREALKRTYGTGQAWFWSRSRQAYWRKGETSGNVLKVQEIRLDCDGDTVLFLVDAAGPACHTGETSCFYRRMTYKNTLEPEFAGDDTGVMAGEVSIMDDGDGNRMAENEVERFAVFRMDDGAKDVPATEGTEQLESQSETAVSAQNLSDIEPLVHLWQTIDERYRKRPEGSYTTYLFEQGVDKVAKKVGEEAVEVVIAAKNVQSSNGAQQELMEESADLLYHLLVLWKQAGICPEQVAGVLQERTR